MVRVVEVFWILGLLGASVVSGLGIGERRSRGRAWQAAAHAAGLEGPVLRSRAGWPVRLDGRRGPLSVRISSYWDRQGNRPGTRIRVQGVTSRIAMRASGIDEKGAQSVFRTGDGAFDIAIAVRGDTDTAAALLDETTRDRVLGLFAHQATGRRRGTVIDMGARLDPGCLSSERAVGDKPVWLGTYLQDLLALAERLRDPQDLVDRLVENLRADTSAGVRLTNLRELLGRPLPLETRATALRIAIEDAAEDVRLEAAIALGAEGREPLLALARDESTSDACAARAVEALGPSLPTEQARELVERARGAAAPRTLSACLDSLSRRGADQQDVIGRALTEVEGDLLPIAARALGRVGTAPSIVLLREAETRWPRHAALRDAVREAVASIRSRLVGAEEGQMSLSESGEVGRVTVSEEGHVSLSEAEGG